MKETCTWKVVSLFDLRGVRICRVRVPCNPLPPRLVEWGVRYFVKTMRDDEYMESYCWLVPLEEMYLKEPPKPQDPGKVGR